MREIKSDILMTALVGSIWFSEQLSVLGWCALLVVTAGVLLLLAGRLGPRALHADDASWRSLLTGRATHVALACALPLGSPGAMLELALNWPDMPSLSTMDCSKR